MDSKKILETKWFSLNTVRYQSSDEEPYYYLSTPDSVEILAITEKKEIIFVKQFRPAIGISMLELPAGYIDPGEKPDDAVKRELTEETGYICNKIDYLGSFESDDETGTIYEQIKTIIKQLDKFKGEQE